MILQAGNDNENGKPGSEVETILKSLPFGDQCVLKEYPNMLHGWLPRGDLSKPEVVREVTDAMRLIKEFLTVHLA